MNKQSKFTKIIVLTASLAVVPFFCGAQQTDIEDLFPVSLDELDLVRGMGGVVVVSNNTNLEAILTNNYNSDSVTGNNTIDTGSFNEAAGVFSIIQNTGNNVIIQDSTIITVTISPN
jgi:hypothetical protein